MFGVNIRKVLNSDGNILSIRLTKQINKLRTDGDCRPPEGNQTKPSSSWEPAGTTSRGPPQSFPVGENCGKTFNPEYNDEENCVWYSGWFQFPESIHIKAAGYNEETYNVPNEDAPIRADGDEDRHRTYESFENNPRYAAGLSSGLLRGAHYKHGGENIPQSSE